MSEPARYWLLTGEMPSGPFTVAEIHAMLAAQGATWDTPACAVGGRTWLPLLRTPGVGPEGPPAGTRHPPPAPSPPAPADRPAPPHPEPPVDRPADPPRSGATRVRATLGGVLVLLVVAGILWRANCTGGDAARDKPGDAASGVPAEYHGYVRDGKFVPTGNPTLDYWVRVNFLHRAVPVAQVDAVVPRVLRDVARQHRQGPTAGVDPDVVRWAAAVAASLDTRADLIERLTDPAALRHASEEAAAGRPNPFDALERAVTDWERERDRLHAEGLALRDALARRHARPFPAPVP